MPRARDTGTGNGHDERELGITPRGGDVKESLISLIP